MTTAELKEKREWLKEIVDNADKETVMKLCDAVTTEVVDDWWDELPDSVKATVEESIAQADCGEVMTHEEAMKKIRSFTVLNVGDRNFKFDRDEANGR